MWLKYDETYSVSVWGQLMNHKTGRVLKPQIRTGGHYRVNLHGKDMSVHRLVGLCFLPHTDIEGLQIDHINRIRTDNRAENLRWVTPSQNSRNNDSTNITKHGNGFQVRFTKGGKYIFHKYFSTLEEATAARDAFKLTDEYKL